jgi:hypothetical protein
VDIAVLDLPFNRRLELITPKRTADGLEERAVELSWNHSIGQGVHKLSKEGMGVSSIVARSFLWRHAGYAYATDLKGWSGTPIALYSADDTNTRVLGFQNWQFMNFTLQFDQLRHDNQYVLNLDALQRGTHPVYGCFLLPQKVLECDIVVKVDVDNEVAPSAEN